MAATFGPACRLPMWIQFFLPSATRRVECAARLLLKTRGVSFWSTHEEILIRRLGFGSVARQDFQRERTKMKECSDGLPRGKPT